jgi:hypothetical protein
MQRRRGTLRGSHARVTETKELVIPARVWRARNPENARFSNNKGTKKESE